MGGNATQQQTIIRCDQLATDSCVALGHTHSWCRSTYPTRGGSRFDYVYGTSGLTVVNHTALPLTSMSDHRAVVTEIDVP
jgi:endonuclease/exonuclease/phosphatase (EEP) superfamily protein YafD